MDCGPPLLHRQVASKKTPAKTSDQRLEVRSTVQGYVVSRAAQRRQTASDAESEEKGDDVMGMADVYQWPGALCFPLSKGCDDPTLSCLLCNRDTCDMTTEWRLSGRRVWVGVHSQSVDISGLGEKEHGR